MTRDWSLGTRDWRLETGDWRLETGDWRLGIEGGFDGEAATLEAKRVNIDHCRLHIFVGVMFEIDDVTVAVKEFLLRWRINIREQRKETVMKRKNGQCHSARR